jgi:MFS family permease
VSPSERPASPRATTAALAACGIVVSLMQTLVVPLLPMLPGILHTSPSAASWVVTATLLAGAVSTPVLGRLGDLLGKRRILLVALGLLVAGSVICAVSTSLLPVVAGRALQGTAMSVVPLGISILREAVPAPRMPAAISTMSATIGVGAAVGLPFSALLAQAGGWATMFWSAALLGALCLGSVAFFVREVPTRAIGRFDLWGALGLSVWLSGLLLVLSRGQSWGWASAATMGTAVLSAVLFGVWVVAQWRRSDPLVDLRVSLRRTVLLTNVATLLCGYAMFSAGLVVPVVFMAAPEGSGYGLSMLTAGLLLAPSGLLMLAMSPVSASITVAWGPRAALAAGTVVITLGYLVGLLPVSSPVVPFVVSTAVGGGIGLAYGAMPSLILSSVPLPQTAAANGLNALMRSVGSSTSSAVVGALLAGAVATGGANGLSTATRVAFATAAAVAACALAATLCVPRRL